MSKISENDTVLSGSAKINKNGNERCFYTNFHPKDGQAADACLLTIPQRLPFQTTL